MRAQDFKAVHEVRNIEELERILATRYENGLNGFWLSHGLEKYPVISLLVKDDLATLHYFPKEGDPGLRSVGNDARRAAEEFTTFALDDVRQKQWVLNEAVVSFPRALEAAKEFLVSEQLPRSIEWLQL